MHSTEFGFSVYLLRDFKCILYEYNQTENENKIKAVLGWVIKQVVAVHEEGCVLDERHTNNLPIHNIVVERSIYLPIRTGVDYVLTGVYDHRTHQ